MTKLVKIIYKGAKSALVVDALGITIVRGEECEVPEAFSAEMLKRYPKDWSLAGAKPKKGVERT